MLFAPGAGWAAGVNVFIGSATIPSAGTDATINPAAADGIGDLPAPSVSGGSSSTPGTANLFVVPTGGTASPTRMSTPTTFASAPSSAQCSTFQACFTAASAGDTIIIRDGSYTGAQATITTGTKSTSSPVVFTGNGSSTTLASLTVGSPGSAGPTGLTIDNVVSSGGLAVYGSNTFTLSRSTSYDFSYFEGPQNFKAKGPNCVFDGQHTTPDVIDVYEQSRETTNTSNWTLDGCTVTGGGTNSDSTTHPDGIQFCNCAGTDSIHATGTLIRATKFIDNWCTNFRANEQSDFTFESNLIYDSATDPFSSCGYSMSMERAASWTMKNNSFLGTQSIQQSPVPTPAPTENWYNNYVYAFETGCRGGNAATGVQSHNWFVAQSCGGTNLTGTSSAANINTTTGIPNSGSPLINAGDSSTFASIDFTSVIRPLGSAPDIGAYEVG